MPTNIEKLIEGTKRTLAEMYERELKIATAKSVQVALRQYADRDTPNENTVKINEYGASLLEHSMKSFKESIEKVLNDLKSELVRGIVEEGTQTKNKYEIVFLKIYQELGHPEATGGVRAARMWAGVELLEGDIPIGYQTYMSGFLTGSSSGTAPTGGQQIVREVIVLRPVVVEGNVQH